MTKPEGPGPTAGGVPIVTVTRPVYAMTGEIAGSIAAVDAALARLDQVDQAIAVKRAELQSAATAAAAAAVAISELGSDLAIAEADETIGRGKVPADLRKRAAGAQEAADARQREADHLARVIVNLEKRRNEADAVVVTQMASLREEMILEWTPAVETMRAEYEAAVAAFVAVVIRGKRLSQLFGGKFKPFILTDLVIPNPGDGANPELVRGDYAWIADRIGPLAYLPARYAGLVANLDAAFAPIRSVVERVQREEVRRRAPAHTPGPARHHSTSAPPNEFGSQGHDIGARKAMFGR